VIVVVNDTTENNLTAIDVSMAKASSDDDDEEKSVVIVKTRNIDDTLTGG